MRRWVEMSVMFVLSSLLSLLLGATLTFGIFYVGWVEVAQTQSLRIVFQETQKSMRRALRLLFPAGPPSTTSSVGMRDILTRLDSFEKEVVKWRIFRAAVEKVNPEVALAAEAMAQERVVNKQVPQDINMEHTLSPEEFEELYQVQAMQPTRALRIDHYMNIANVDDLLRFARVANRDFATRIAKRAATLNHAPLGFSRMKSIEDLRKCYEWSFHDVVSSPPPTDKASLLHFDGLVRRIFLRHFSVTPLLFSGLQELAKRENLTKKRLMEDRTLYEAYQPLQTMFEEFILDRARLRFWVSHYMNCSTHILGIDASTTPPVQPMSLPMLFNHPDTSFTGCICRETRMVDLVRIAVAELKEKYSYLDDDQLPEISLRVAGDENLTFANVPLFTMQMLKPLIDAAIHANVQRSEDCGTACTPVDIVIAQSPRASDITVRVSDTAGGIPLDDVPRTLDLLYCCDAHNDEIELSYAAVAARTFGGELQVASINGYGTDRTLCLPSGQRLLQLEL